MTRFAAFRVLSFPLLIICGLASVSARVIANQQARSRSTEPFLPVAVWYGGGHERAPMLQAEPEKHRAEWRADLQKIKQLGFSRD